MAFDSTLPLDDGYLAEAPGQLREQFRALKDDKIINAGKLKGLEPGNASGNVPINNGTLNTNLNADQLDGHDSAYFSASTHTHADATTNAAGLMSAADKVKLNGIAAGAEVNQNAFAKIKAGSAVVEADQKQDTLELVAGSNITITPDTANDKLTIALPPTISANTSGDAATCNGCGRVVPTELTDDNAMSHLESGFYKTEGNATLGGAGGRKFSAIIQTMRGQDRGGRIIFGAWSDNTKLEVSAQAFNGEWGPLKPFVLQGDTFTGTVDGNAATATRLQTGRTINGVMFDGSGNINISAPANGGNAATATRLQTGRTINGVMFDGSGNINISAPANGGNAATASMLQKARAIVIRYYSTRVQSKGVVERTYDQGYEYFNGTGDVIINVGCVSGCATTCISGCADSCGGSCKGNCRGSCGGDN